jgi:ferrous iron transport protein B
MTRSCTVHESGPVTRPEGDFVMALAGNPNVGKSSIFNALTGVGVSTAHYPGTTRAVHTATARAGERIVGIVDLPGTYALGGSSEDERVARRALLDVDPDAVVVVLDPFTLARTLYLALEILDLGFPVVLAVNLADEARRAGVTVDVDALRRRLDVPVVSTVATQGLGVADLVSAALETASQRAEPPVYGADFEALLEPLVSACGTAPCTPHGLCPRAAALGLVSGDRSTREGVRPEILEVADTVIASMRSRFGEVPDLALPVPLVRETLGLLRAFVNHHVPARMKALDAYVREA